MTENRLTKTLVLTEDSLWTLDTLVRGDELWLVPEWIDGSPNPGFSKPARAIRMRGAQKAPPGGGAEFALPGKLPNSVLDGATTSAEDRDYEVLTLPDFFVETPNDEPTSQ